MIPLEVYMNNNLVKDFLKTTFIIMIIFWGGAAVLSQTLELTINNVLL